MKVVHRGTSAIAAGVLSLGCGPASEGAPASPLSGGATTIVDRTSAAFSQPAPDLTSAELDRHRDGDAAFSATFVTAPAPIHGGLGPLFNNTSCGACHLHDGRGAPTVGADSLGSQLLVRVSTANGEAAAPGAPGAAPGLGTQIQDHATFGYAPEARITVQWTDAPGVVYSGGETLSLRRPAFEITLADGTPLPSDVLTSARTPPPVFGLGLLEAVAEADVLALADPDDADGDGISGRTNDVWRTEGAAPALGRFGWKANTPDLKQQAAAAYVNDMGVTSPLFPEADGTSELDEATLEATTFYTQTLAVPVRGDTSGAEVKQGEGLFESLGCAACHLETLRTSPHAVAVLSEQTFHPYTDLLLHDLGPDLADGRPDFDAGGSEWRTAPLWGLGLTQTVSPGAGYLHDGRARTVEEAIAWHGGEARASREAFCALDADARAALLAFLASL